jgi:hypothetical protein
MKCTNCRSFKRFLCILACKDANAELCKIDDAIKEREMGKQQWQIDLEAETLRDDIKHGVLLILALACLYLLFNVSSCGHVGGAETANAAALYRAAHQKAAK